MKKLLSLSKYLLVFAVVIVGTLFLARKAKSNREEKNLQDNPQVIERLAHETVTDPVLKEALENPEQFQEQAMPANQEVALVSSNVASEAASGAIQDKETTSNASSKPLDPALAQERKERMGQGLIDFASLRTEEFRDPDSKLNRETLAKLEDKRKLRLQALKRETIESPAN